MKTEKIHTLYVIKRESVLGAICSNRWSPERARNQRRQKKITKREALALMLVDTWTRRIVMRVYAVSSRVSIARGRLQGSCFLLGGCITLRANGLLGDVTKGLRILRCCVFRFCVDFSSSILVNKKIWRQVRFRALQGTRAQAQEHC